MDTIEDKIRVMTVHGAKGLEAPIVILPDTAARSAPTTPDVVDHHGIAVWKPNKNLVPNTLNPTLDSLKMRQVDERDRLLYVALTRAESWLIVMGSGDIKEEADCWYNAIQSAAIAKGAAPLITAAGSGLRYEPKPWSTGALRPMEKLEREKCQVPVWAKTTTSPVPQKINPRAPSDLGGDKVVSNTLTEANPDALSLGEAVHSLLEVLPNIPKEQWKTVAEKLVKSEVFLQAWAEAQDILMHPDLAHIFAPGTLAEVNISAHIDELNGNPIQGSIDRLIVSADKVLAIDFKTNQIVPENPSHVPEGILRQLGAYAAALKQVFPNHAVETSVLWTKTRCLMEMPNDLIINSLQRVSSS
jgi:ATP-dependent helicase/nuclease subunit A